jgi:hypothetical protein
MAPKKAKPVVANQDSDSSDRESDEDFNPEGAVEEEEEASQSSAAEDQPAVPVRGRKGKKRRQADTEDVELDSGDEATIQERRRKRKKGGDVDYISEGDDGGEGGLVKTRAQRRTQFVTRYDFLR